MGQRLQLVVENGALKPVEPLDLTEGEVLNVDLVSRHIPEVDEEEETRLWEEALDAISKAAAEVPPGWWEEFHRDLNENRLNFPVRFP